MDGIGPAHGAFVNTPEGRSLPDGPGPEWTYLPGGWVAFDHPALPGHRVSILTDNNPGSPALIGLRVEPRLDATGQPRPDTPPLTASALGSLRVKALRDLAGAAMALDLTGLPEAYTEATGQGRKPYRGSDEHRRAVEAVHRTAAARGETPALAIMRAFGVSRATAYLWIRDYRLKGEQE